MQIKKIDTENFPEVEAIASYHIGPTFYPPKPCPGVGAFEDGMLVAYISLVSEYPGTYSIPSLATRHGYEGRGYLKALFQHIDITLNSPNLWLEVHPKNERAMKMYRNLGFHFVESKGTYPDGATMLLGERKWQN